MMTLIERWFAPTPVPQDYQVRDYVALWLILSLGVFLRFWGLGNVGLHGDEETMAMPAMAILETGHPYLPSGMYYSRALLNIYLMSGSAWLFGESEWAFRLPSAIVGSLTGLAAFFMGRRFLSPQFNLAFVATVTFLPAMIVISQTARMYVFLVTCVLWFGACLFRWERDQRISSLILALLVWMLSLHFQTLAIFAAPLFLFPGLSRRSWKQLFQGAAAFVVGGLLFRFYSSWIASKYPQQDEHAPPLPATESYSSLEVLLAGNGWVFGVGLALAAGLSLLMLFRLGKKHDWRQLIPPMLIGLASVAIVFLHYHVAGLLLVSGAVFWLRNPGPSRSWLVAGILLALALAATNLALLYTSGLFPGRKVLGAVLGMPSIWPVLRFLQYSPVAGMIYLLVIAFALTGFAKGRPLPMHLLFFSMAVWGPLFLLGLFTWDMPPRYAIAQLGFLLVCTFAGVAYLFHEFKPRASEARSSFAATAALALISVAVINPLALGGIINPDYDEFPDHKGAAEYIESLGPDGDAILIAEDVLQQTYYLGKVDYWLREIDNANSYSIVRDGQLVDLYTLTPVLGTGAELESVIDRSNGDAVYVIGSGENFVKDKRLFRGRGISELLESKRFRVVYTGRDGKTQVWKLVQ